MMAKFPFSFLWSLFTSWTESFKEIKYVFKDDSCLLHGAIFEETSFSPGYQTSNGFIDQQ